MGGSPKLSRFSLSVLLLIRTVIIHIITDYNHCLHHQLRHQWKACNLISARYIKTDDKILPRSIKTASSSGVYVVKIAEGVRKPAEPRGLHTNAVGLWGSQKRLLLYYYRHTQVGMPNWYARFWTYQLHLRPGLYGCHQPHALCCQTSTDIRQCQVAEARTAQHAKHYAG